MRPVHNPPNPYHSRELEWLEEPPEARLQVFEEEARTVLAENSSPDLGFRFSLNPYRGCTHACAYCYARPDHERLGFGAGSDFESKIVVKINAPECLRREFLRPSWKGELVAFSGDTDCYQPLEAHYRLTRRCLEVCREFGNPVGIITKAGLIRRDVDLLADLARKGLVHVAISLAFVSPDLQKKIEPGAPPPNVRLEALRILSEAGVPTSLLFAPIIPGLNDHEIPETLEAAALAGAQRAGAILLRLPGSTEAVFYERLSAAFPDREERIRHRLLDTREGRTHDTRFFERHRGTGTYWQAIADLFELHLRRLQLNREIPHPTSAHFRRPGDEQLSLFGD